MIRSRTTSVTFDSERPMSSSSVTRSSCLRADRVPDPRPTGSRRECPRATSAFMWCDTVGCVSSSSRGELADQDPPVGATIERGSGHESGPTRRAEGRADHPSTTEARTHRPKSMFSTVHHRCSSAGWADVGAAHTGRGQHEFDLARRVQVAGEPGADGSHLLVPGRQEEGRRSPVALHPGDEEVLFRVLELEESVRLDGAAGVHVGVDERREQPRCFHDFVERESHLAEHVQVGPESGRVDDRVDAESPRRSPAAAADDHVVAVSTKRVDLESVDLLDHAGGDEGVDRAAERGPGGELVVVRAADAHRAGVADCPGDRGSRLGRGQARESDQRVRGRVPGADDEGAATRESGAVASEDVGKGVAHRILDVVPAERVEAVGAQAVRMRVGAGRVDHGPRGDLADARTRPRSAGRTVRRRDPSTACGPCPHATRRRPSRRSGCAP